MADHMEKLRMWSTKIREFLGKSAGRRYKNIALDIQCVDCGIKPSFLFDYGFVSAETMHHFVQELNRNGLTENTLQVVSVEDEVFICNPHVVRDLILKKIPEGYVKVIDVSKDTGDPRVLEQMEGKCIIEKMTHQLSTQLQLITVTESDHGQSDPDMPKAMSDNYTKLNRHAEQCSGDSCSTQNCDNGNPVNKGMQFLPVVKLILDADISRPSLFGLLLGYPIVYWYGTNPKQEENCISLGPLALRVYQVQATYAHLGVSANERNYRHTIYSFSCPEIHHEIIEEGLSHWYKNIQAATDSCSIFSDSAFTSDSVNVPVLAM